MVTRASAPHASDGGPDLELLSSTARRLREDIIAMTTRAASGTTRATAARALATRARDGDEGDGNGNNVGDGDGNEGDG